MEVLDIEAERIPMDLLSTGLHGTTRIRVKFGCRSAVTEGGKVIEGKFCEKIVDLQVPLGDPTALSGAFRNFADLLDRVVKNSQAKVDER